MTNILTAAQAANFLRSTADDAVMLQFLPLIDSYLENATGHDWTGDDPIHPTAIIAAGMLLTFWYDNPGLVGVAPETVMSQLVQLEVEAIKHRKYQFAGLAGAGSIKLTGALKGDQVIKLLGMYGVSGDQKANFESAISVADHIQQTSGSDLSGNLYAVVLKSPFDDVSV